MAYDWTELETRLFGELARSGPTGSAELCERLAISQPTFQRLVERRIGDAVLKVGRARATRYAARHSIPDVGDRVPIYRIDSDGQSDLVATLHAILPRGAFYCEGLDASIPSGAHDDLPFFLSPLRPAGFLGRLIPDLHPELGLPQDILMWSSSQCLQYLTRFGWNLPGDFIVGEEAMALFLRHTRELTDGIPECERARRYMELADNVLEQGDPGSSAAGERPKFLATLEEGATSILVKFSPPRSSGEVAQREADLLVAEAWAHRVLEQSGTASARSEVIDTEDRLFLQIERFDRVGLAGRRGLLALDALEAEYVGAGGTWSAAAEQLSRQSIIDERTRDQIQFLELFGRLIGNSDMHLGNLSLMTDGVRVEHLSPVYDMLPMGYAPRHGEIHSRSLALPEPHPSMARMWWDASEVALGFWQGVADDERVSDGFRAIAAGARAAVADWQADAQRLPRVSGASR